MLQLDAATLDRLYPCRITINEAGLITRLGPSLMRLLGAGLVRRPFVEHFSLIDPVADMQLSAMHLQRIQISARQNPDLCFGGCVVATARTDTPGHTELLLAALARGAVDPDTPLRYRDFAPTDNALDMLMAMQTRAALAQDAERLSRELAHARAGELANEAKGRFIANISHELRTPLNSIIGYTEIVCEELADGDTSNCLSDLGYVQAAARHLLMIVGNMLDLAKIDAGRMDVETLPLDFATIVRDAVAIMAPAAAKSQNTIIVDVDESLCGISDPTKVRQCLLNLLSNAVKFTDNGIITVTVRLVLKGAEEHVEIAVEDEGPGMDETTQKKLFAPFVQESAATSRKHGGTGLGLAITRELCRLLGGDVTVSSAVGVGSRFVMSIARGLKPAGSAQERAPNRVAA